jgi:predicted phosphodiesterase
VRYLILSDIHANLDALEAVLAAVPRADFDRVVVLGDLVGYGANPNEVVALVDELAPAVLVRGNHDKVAAGLADPDEFTDLAAQAARWTQATLTAASRARLAALPRGPLLVDETLEVCHGTPYDEDAYLLDRLDALRAFEAARRPVCLFGHTHHAVVIALEGDRLETTLPGGASSVDIALRDGVRYLINPGSVGQPRDGDPRAAYAVLDTTVRRVTLKRVPYPIERAQRRIREAGLPAVLAQRLAFGR